MFAAVQVTVRICQEGQYLRAFKNCIVALPEPEVMLENLFPRRKLCGFSLDFCSTMKLLMSSY